MRKDSGRRARSRSARSLVTRNPACAASAASRNFWSSGSRQAGRWARSPSGTAEWMRRASRRHSARQARRPAASSVRVFPRSYPSARSSSASQAASMKTSVAAPSASSSSSRSGFGSPMRITSSGLPKTTYSAFSYAAISSGVAGIWALPLPPQLSLLDQLRDIVRAADQHALHEHHGKGRPAGPHLEDEAAAVFAEIAAVLEVLVREPGGIERLSRLLRKRIHTHADDDDVVRRHRS